MEGSVKVSPISAMRSKTHVQLVGQSPAMASLQQEVDRVARSDAKVLITGESGVGKEIVAKSIHARGPRATNIFAPVNCAGLPETLLESELFGHVKGSFTGAYRDKPGKLEMAHMGTTFLDEVGEMTLRMQGLLLRFLETGEIQKVGSEGAGRNLNVRVIAATNRDLRDMIKQGTFREDLFYRLNVIHIVVPPLRERREDIPLLVAAIPRAVPGAEPVVDHDGVAGSDEGADGVLVAGQRPRARERHRAARRHGSGTDDRGRTPVVRDSRAGPGGACVRSASADAPWPTTCISA